MYDITIDQFILIFVVNYYSNLKSKQQIIPFEEKPKEKNNVGNDNNGKALKRPRASDQSNTLDSTQSEHSNTLYLPQSIFLDIPQYLLRFKLPGKNNQDLKSFKKN